MRMGVLSATPLSLLLLLLQPTCSYLTPRQLGVGTSIHRGLPSLHGASQCRGRRCGMLPAMSAAALVPSEGGGDIR